MVRLATPVVVVQLGMMAMGVVDTMMLGRVSEEALAAGALGNTISFGALAFAMGMLMALDPLVSQAHGAGDAAALSRGVQRGLVLAVAVSVPIGLFLFDTRPLLELLRQDPAIRDETAAYIRAIVPSVPLFLLFVVARQSLQAMGLVRQAVIAIVVANLVNVAANWALIFGNWGFPALGVVGSAWSTTISRGVMMIAIFAAGWSILSPYLRTLRRSVLQLSSYGDLLRLGVPIGFQVSLEMWLFATVALLMGNLGARDLAAHQIALTLSALTFMVPLGIAGAVTTRVGNAIGRGDADGARRAAALGLGLGAGVMLVSATLFATFPEALSRLFTPEAAVIALAARLLPIAAVFQVFDGLQVVGAGVLRGAADTRIAAVFAFVGYWLLGLPLGATLAYAAGLGPVGLWWGLTLGLGATASLFLLRIRVTFRGELKRFGLE